MTRVKICGITRSEDAALAVELGAWAIGLIFHAPSPRACDPAKAERIGAEMKRRAEVTGVFVNEPLEDVVRMAERCSLSMLQLHGDEGPAYCEEAARRSGCKVMKAARVTDRASLQQLRPYRVDYHLLDAHDDDRFGGTGETFDWELVSSHEGDVPVILSGGLTAENVREGIAATGPFGVDTASGTEAAPGRKDPRKLRAFFRAVAAASEAEGPPRAAA